MFERGRQVEIPLLLLATPRAEEHQVINLPVAVLVVALELELEAFGA